jgi:serine/threonine-protein kinase RsbT
VRLEKIMMRNALKLQISEATDVAYAALDAKDFARDLGFSIADQYTIATAVSELAQNIVKYADFGHLSFKTIQQGSDVGIEVLAKDSGPGIENINHAMTDNVSTGGTMGVGLPGTKRLMDDFHINSAPGQGTEVVVKKWR